MKPWLSASVILGLAFAPLSAQQAPPNLPLVNSSIKTLTGTFNPQAPKRPADPTGVMASAGGCNFTFTPGVGERALEARLRSRLRFDENTGTCRAEFEVGTPQEAVLQWDAEQLKNADARESAPGRAPAKGGEPDSRPILPRQVYGYADAAGYFYASMQDPISIVLNSIQVGLNPFYVTQGWPEEMSPLLTAVTNYSNYALADGWHVTSESTGKTAEPYWDIEFYTNTSFANSIFPACLGGTVTVSYNNAAIIGYFNGQVASSGSWTIYGPVSCIYLLTPIYRVVQTLNPFGVQ
jgi:hypothetical protein